MSDNERHVVEHERLRGEIHGLLDQIDTLVTDNERLRRWKAEAIEVITQWEEVWETLGDPGPIGSSKARASLDKILSLRLNLVGEES